MSIYDDIKINHKLPEMKQIKDWFETHLQKQKSNDIVGSFGANCCMYGNAIQWIDLPIPAKAMKIIYEFNKDNIEKFIEETEKQKEEQEKPKKKKKPEEPNFSWNKTIDELYNTALQNHYGTEKDKEG